MFCQVARNSVEETQYDTDCSDKTTLFRHVNEKTENRMSVLRVRFSERFYRCQLEACSRGPHAVLACLAPGAHCCRACINAYLL